MATEPVGPASSPTTPASSSPAGPGATKFELGPVKLEATLPKWAIALLSVLILAALTGAGIFFAVNKVREVETQAQIEQQKLKEDSMRQIEKVRNSVLVPKDDMAVYQEEAKHAADRPRMKEELQSNLHQDGSVLIHHYYNDGCVHIIRLGSEGQAIDQKWIFGPQHKFDSADAPKPADTPQLPAKGSEIKENWKIDLGRSSKARFRKAVYNELEGDSSSPQVSLSGDLTKVMFQGRCMDPHPGGFSFQNVPINQCLVQVNRFFQDGCAHYQFYNSCSGAWDVWPNGAAKVTWTRCLH